VRVYLNPLEEVRRRWKVQRDCSRRGYTTDQVLAELDRREPDSHRCDFRSLSERFSHRCSRVHPPVPAVTP
jgi:uridine kinase